MTDSANFYLVGTLYPYLARATYPRLGFPQYAGEVAVSDADDDIYWLDVPHFRTSAIALDAIMQVAGKSWADDRVLAGLIRALDDVLYPQANLCSGGQSKTMPVEQIRERIAEVAKWPAT